MPKKVEKADPAATADESQAQAEQAGAEPAQPDAGQPEQEQTGQEEADAPAVSDPAPAEQKQEPEPAEEIALVRMVRDVPQHQGGPVTADVHPDEVAGYSAGGWRAESKD